MLTTHKPCTYSHRVIAGLLMLSLFLCSFTNPAVAGPGATQQSKHFVLIHGALEGRWIWYKIQARLEKAGHQVTPLICRPTVLTRPCLNS